MGKAASNNGNRLLSQADMTLKRTLSMFRKRVIIFGEGLLCFLYMATFSQESILR